MKNGDIIVFFYLISCCLVKLVIVVLWLDLERLSAPSGAQSKSEYGITSLGGFL
jgi:hypothetical protein